MATPEELPPQVTFGSYLVIRDEYAEEKVIELPDVDAVLVFKGGKIRWSTGEEGDAIPLGNAEPIATGSSIVGIVVLNEQGEAVYVSSGPTDSKLRYLTFTNGIPTLKTFDSSFPEGSGILLKNSEGSIQILGAGGNDGRGLFYVGVDGVVKLISDYQVPVGQVLTMTDTGPVFRPTTSLTRGGVSGATGIDTVTSTNDTAGSAVFKADTLVLANVSGDQVTVAGFNQTVTISGNVGGAGALDVNGNASTSQFYYIYALAKEDGSTGIVASLSNVAPSLTLTVDFLYFVLIGMIYVKSTGQVRPYIQQGRRFWIEETLYVANWQTPGTFTAVPGDVSLSAIVPNGFVKTVSGVIGGGSAETNPRSYLVSPTLSGIAPQIISKEGGSFNNFKKTQDNFSEIAIANSVSPNFFVRVNVAAGSVRTRITVTGFTI